MSPATIQISGFAIGAIAGIISILGLWAGVYFFTHKFEPNMQPPFPRPVLISALILKLPALVGGWLIARSLGTAGPVAFGLGIVLVYSLAVARIALQSRRD